MSSTKTPMDLIKQFAPEFAQESDGRESPFSSNIPNYQSVPAKYKTLMGIAVAAALGSEKCTEMWARQAKDKGVTKREITEAIMVARFMKQATVNDTAAKTLTWLARIRRRCGEPETSPSVCADKSRHVARCAIWSVPTVGPRLSNPVDEIDRKRDP